MEWQPEIVEKPGLYVFGRSGCGKTRTVFLRLRQFIEEGLDVRYLRSAEFARELISRTMPGGIGGAAGWLEELREVDVLCLDEVEKLKFSERVQAEFFELVEVRLSREVPTLFVGNVPPDAIASRMDESYAEAFERRIREFCLGVAFEPKPKKR